MASLNQTYDNVPLPLQSLKAVNQLLIKQKVERLEVFLGLETNNKYAIKNAQGEDLFYAAEDNDCCTRMCLGSIRPFDLKILDNTGNEVIRLHRDFACQSCCFPCCLQKLEVYSPPGNLVGTVEQTWSILTPMFDIKNESGNTVLQIEGPCCQFNCCADVEFHVMTLDKARVGKISKQWSGLLREAFTDADFFGISFPEYLDVRMKAVMIGACFLIDFMYFEKNN